MVVILPDTQITGVVIPSLIGGSGLMDYRGGTHTLTARARPRGGCRSNQTHKPDSSAPLLSLLLIRAVLTVMHKSVLHGADWLTGNATDPLESKGSGD